MAVAQRKDPPSHVEPASRAEVRALDSPSSTRLPIVRSLFAALFFLALYAPLSAMLFGRFGAGGDKLGGVEQTVALPAATLPDFLSGTYQEGLEKWLSTHIGLRGPLIRTENQLNYSVFGFNSSRSVVGKNNFLFERLYIDDWNGFTPVTDEELGRFAGRLELLMSLLGERGVKFLVFLTPSKVALYPENLPEHLSLSKRGPGTYPRFLAMLNERNVPVLDGIAFARQMKKESPYPVFPPGAAHWSSYVSCKCGELFVETLRTLLGKSISGFTCDPPVVRIVPQTIDMDLAQLANLWTMKPFQLPLPYPKIRVERRPESYYPKLLFVGDSFLWVFLHHLERHPIYESRDFFYYYKAEQRFRRRQKPGRKTPLDPSAIDWSRVFTRDVVVLELNEIRIREAGFGFVEDALRELQAAPAAEGEGNVRSSG